MKHIVLFSGGPDSLATYLKIKSVTTKVEVIYFDLGHRYASLEKKVCENLFPGRKKVIISDVLLGLGQWEEEDAHIWYRNAFLCLAASKYVGKGLGNIYLTVQKDELNIPDRTQEFMNQMSKLFRSLGQNIQVSSPWIYHDKTDMIREILVNNKNPNNNIAELFKKTWSCYKPVPIMSLHNMEEDTDNYSSYLQCGDCPACFRRWVAFSLNNIEERYIVSPWLTDTSAEYKRRAEAGEYSVDRCKRILDALAKKEKEDEGK